MRPKASREWLSARRERAISLLERGHTLRAVARVIGCAPSSVKRWRDAWEEDGEVAIEGKEPVGRPRRLGSDAERGLFDVLRVGPRAHGIPLRQWTTRAIALVIARHHGVTFHRDHVRRMMRRSGWDWWSRQRVEAWLQGEGALWAYPRPGGAWLPTLHYRRAVWMGVYQSMEGWSIEPCRRCNRATARDRKRLTT